MKFFLFFILFSHLYMIISISLSSSAAVSSILYLALYLIPPVAGRLQHFVMPMIQVFPWKPVCLMRWDAASIPAVLYGPLPSAVLAARLLRRLIAQFVRTEVNREA